MNIQPGSLTAIGIVRGLPGGTTAANPNSSDFAKNGATALSGDSSVKTDFLSFADMRSQMLGALGTDEASLKAMTPADRKAVEDKIRDQMQAAVEANAKGEYNPGRLADVKA
jgi:hypothetical protein